QTDGVKSLYKPEGDLTFLQLPPEWQLKKGFRVEIKVWAKWEHLKNAGTEGLEVVLVEKGNRRHTVRLALKTNEAAVEIDGDRQVLKNAFAKFMLVRAGAEVSLELTRNDKGILSVKVARA